MITRTAGRQAMTLIELLIVTFILAAMATSVVAVTDSMDQAQRARQTFETLAAIRTASSGPGPSAERLGIGGFIQDLARLPEDGAALLRNSAGASVYGYNSTWKVWSGWRGPYLVPPLLRATETSGTAFLYDGWGKDFTWTIDTNGLTVSSSNLPLLPPPPPLVANNTWTKDISDLPIQFLSRATVAPLLSLRLRVVHPPIATVVPDAVDNPLNPTISGVVLPGAWVPLVATDADYLEGYRFRTAVVPFGQGESTARRIASGRRTLIVITVAGEPLDPVASPDAWREHLFLVSEPDSSKPLRFDCGILP